MIRRLDLRGKCENLDKSSLQLLVPRAALSIDAVMPDVLEIIDKVIKGDEGSILAIGASFDGIAPKEVRVPEEVIDRSLLELDPNVKEALLRSIDRIKKVHLSQRREDETINVSDGATVTERWIPVDRVALYVPGGRAVYPSSVMMNVIPAQIAKVPSIAILSPAQVENDGWPHPTILATAALLGVREVYSLGGAVAIAAAAYGVRDLRGEWAMAPADMVTGPGNIYVAAAKRALRGRIGIDSEAGPTEIAIVADESAQARIVAADLISQAEHDTIAAAVLITDSEKLAAEVEEELVHRVGSTRHGDRIREALGGTQSAIVLVDSIADAIKVANLYAAEHLEIQTRDDERWASQIRNAGAVFLGRFTPVSLGDYSAGSNHVLPTGGCACHSSGLSVQSFLRGLHFIQYDRSALSEVASTVITLAEAENLPAHGEAITVRFDD